MKTGKWSARSLGSRFQHGIFYALIRLGGRRAAYLLLFFVVGWYALFSGEVARRCAPYILSRFGPGIGWRFKVRVFKMCLGLGKALIDRAVAGIAGPSALEMKFAGDGLARLRGLIGEGKGLIVVMSHVGPWQASIAALERLDAEVYMLMRREEGDIDRHYHEHAGVECPYKVIDPSGYLGGAVEMVEALDHGAVLCVMGDRLFGEEGNALEVEFLGKPAPFPVSAYKVAASTGAPVAVLFARESGAGGIVMELAEVLRVERPPRKETARLGLEVYRPYLERYVDALEGYARKYPYQFFNFFDMWTSDKDK